MNVKARRNGIAVLVIVLILSLIGFSVVASGNMSISVSADTSNSSAPVLRYDFDELLGDDETSVSLTGDKTTAVQNKGSWGVSEQTNGTVYGGNSGVEGNGISIDSADGKKVLRILQTNGLYNDASKANGYFQLPQNAFSNLNAFTFRMDVLWTRMCEWEKGILHFTPVDPVTTEVSSGTFIEYSHNYANSKWGYCFAPWGTYATNVHTDENITDPQTAYAYGDVGVMKLTITWDGSNIKYYDGNTLVHATVISKATVNNLKYNRIGGLLYTWHDGRNATNGTFDNIELYDRYMTAEQVKALNDGLIMNFDFSEDSVSVDGNVTTVANKGANPEWVGKLVNSATNEANRTGRVADGKLTLDRRGDWLTGDAVKDNAYFELPSDMFKGLSEFTFMMDVDHVDLMQWKNYNPPTGVARFFSTTNLIYFTQNDPINCNSTSEIGNRSGVFWNQYQDGTYTDDDGEEKVRWRYTLNYDGSAGMGWHSSVVKDTSHFVENSLRYPDFKTQQFMLTIVYKNNILSYYWDNTLVMQTTEVTQANMESLVYNRIGGYVLKWADGGRGAVVGEFDNIKLYNTAFTADKIAEKVTERESYTDVIITGNGKNILMQLTPYSSYMLPEIFAGEDENKVLLGYFYRDVESTREGVGAHGWFYKPGDIVGADNENPANNVCNISGRSIKIKAVLMDMYVKGGSIRLKDSNDHGLRFRASFTPKNHDMLNFKDVADSYDYDDINTRFDFFNGHLGARGMIVTDSRLLKRFGAFSIEDANYIAYDGVKDNANYHNHNSSDGMIYGVDSSGAIIGLVDSSTAFDWTDSVENLINYVVGITPEYFGLDYTARAYLNVTYSDDTSRNVYSATYTQNAKDVAQKALDQVVYVNKYQKAILDMYANGESRNVADDTLNDRLKPIWDDGGLAVDETAFVIKNETGSGIDAITMAYPISEIVSVTNYGQTVTYKAGVDYTLENGKLRVLTSGSIEAINYGDFYLSEDTGDSGKSMPLINGSGAQKVSEAMISGGEQKQGMTQWQVSVTYRHTASWQDASVIPEDKSETMYKTNKKLMLGENFNIVCLGDSISEGYASSGFRYSNLAPHCPPYYELVSDYINQRFSCKVTSTNLAIGGKSASWGMLANQTNAVIAKDPDLLILAFGMNDGTTFTASTYKTNIKKIIDAVRAGCPDVEIVVVGTMLPNAEIAPLWGPKDSNGNPTKAPLLKYQRDYVPALKEIESEYNGVAFANMTAMSDYVVSSGRKRFQDITSSNSNHPNDYFHRVYAQVVLTTIFGKIDEVNVSQDIGKEFKFKVDYPTYNWDKDAFAFVVGQ